MSAAGPLPDGLPGPLPEGERVLWRGAPTSRVIARHALHERLVMGYFAALSLYVAWAGIVDARPRSELAISLSLVALAGLAVFGLIRLFAVLVHRSSVYVITDRRVVMRIGVALPLTLNVPFDIVQGAGLRSYPDGTGDIPIAIGGTGRIAYLHLWPHARPWRLRRPEPMLRGVPDAREVAAILARAVAAGRSDVAPVLLSPDRSCPAPDFAPAAGQLAA